MSRSAKATRFAPTARKGCGLLLALACVTFTLAMVVWYLTRPHDLLVEAVYRGSAVQFDKWVSDTEFMDWPTGAGEGRRWGNRPIIITRYNVVTGQRTHYRLAQPEIALLTHSSTIPSPDGKWLLWTSLGADDDTAIELATGKTRTWPEDGDEYHMAAAWMPDSRHWVTVPTLANGYMLIHSVLAGEKDIRCKAEYSWDWRKLGDTAITSGGHLLSIESPDFDSASPVLIIHEYTLGASSVVVGVRTTPCPPSLENPIAVISPSGKEIAWYGIKRVDTHLQALLHRLLPVIPAPTQRLGCICISNVGGSNFRDLGVLSLPNDDNAWQPNVAWLPGEKAVSFQHEGGLYTISVNKP